MAPASTNSARPRSTASLLSLAIAALVMLVLFVLVVRPWAGTSGSARANIKAPVSAAAARLAQSNLSAIVTPAEAIYAETQRFPASQQMVAALSNADPSVAYTTGSVSSGNAISVQTLLGGQGVLLVSETTGGGTCWAVQDVQAAPAGASGVRHAAWNSATGKCSAQAMPPGTQWLTKFPRQG